LVLDSEKNRFPLSFNRVPYQRKRLIGEDKSVFSRTDVLSSQYNGAPEIIGFEARTQINRKDFGLNWNVSLENVGVLVSDLIKIEIAVDARRQSA